MKDNLSTPNIGLAPLEYSSRYFDDANRLMLVFIRDMLSRGTISLGGMKLYNLPPSSAGLSKGDVYQVNGTLKVVVDTSIIRPSSVTATSQVGTETVLTDQVLAQSGVPATGQVGDVTVVTP